MLINKEEVRQDGLDFLRERVRDLERSVEMYINAVAGQEFVPENARTALRNLACAMGECRGISNALCELDLITSQESRDFNAQGTSAYNKACDFVMTRVQIAETDAKPLSGTRFFIDWELLDQVKIEVDSERGRVTIAKGRSQ